MQRDNVVLFAPMQRENTLLFAAGAKILFNFGIIVSKGRGGGGQDHVYARGITSVLSYYIMMSYGSTINSPYQKLMLVSTLPGWRGRVIYF
jgi:hypothetical protein